MAEACVHLCHQRRHLMVAVVNLDTFLMNYLQLTELFSRQSIQNSDCG